LRVILFIFILLVVVHSAKYKITNVIDKQYFNIITQNKLIINKSVFVISKYANIEYISSIASIISKDDTKYTLKVLEYSPFSIKSKPYLKPIINKNSYIVDDLFKNKALILAPNIDIYNNAKIKLPTLELINPDLLAFSINGNVPNKDELISFAKENTISYYYLIFSNEIYKIDAFSLKIININKWRNANTGFYTKKFFNNIYSSSSISSEKSLKFKNYYMSLINH